MRYRDYRIRLTSANDFLELSPYGVCRVIEGGLAGFDIPKWQNGLGLNGIDGRDTNNLPARKLAVTFEVTDRDVFGEIRDKAYRFSAMGRKTEIAVYYMGRYRYIDAYPSGESEISHKNFDGRMTVTLSFLAPDVYFTEKSTVKFVLPQNTPLLNFPVNFMSGAGATFSYAYNQFTAKIINPGDAPCPIKAIYNVTGEVVNPSLSCGGRRLKLLMTLSAGDTVTFTTEEGKKQITVNGNYSYKYDINSRFPILLPGLNSLSVNADSGITNINPQIEFSPRYNGI